MMFRQIKTKPFFYLILALLITASTAWLVFGIFGKSLKAAEEAPTIEFIGGDDFLGDGGTNDSYDSLIIFRAESKVEALDQNWQLEWSSNGSNWNPIDENNSFFSLDKDQPQFVRTYYWFTNNTYAPTLHFRARNVFDEVVTDYTQATLSLSHRLNNLNSHYIVEDFLNRDDLNEGALNNMDISPTPEYGGRINLIDLFAPGNAASRNLLEGFESELITKITFRPVQLSTDSSFQFKYQFSLNGTDWLPEDGIVHEATQIMPPAESVYFNKEKSDKSIFWRVEVINNGYGGPEYDGDNDQVLLTQMRIEWQENFKPQACFSVSPFSSEDPEQVYSFNPACTWDFEDDQADLQYYWDFDSDGTIEVSEDDPVTVNWNYTDTEEHRITLSVTDSFDAEDDFAGDVNAAGVTSSLYGWAWGSFGWMSLNCDNEFDGNPNYLCNAPNATYGWSINPNSSSINGWSWSPYAGWLCVGNSCCFQGEPGECSDDPQPPEQPLFYGVEYSPSDGRLMGWGRFVNYDAETGPGNQSLNWLAMSGAWCQDDGNPENYRCVQIDMNDLTFTSNSYAWNGFVDEQGNRRGLGWVKFWEGYVNYPWLETQYGLIYGLSNIESTFGPPQDRYNSTYCIRAEGVIRNFRSGSSCIEKLRDSMIPYPTFDQDFYNNLSNYPKEEITCEKCLEDVGLLKDAIGANQPLGNRVFEIEITGDPEQYNKFVISEPITFLNARGRDSSGAGTIIVNGNLLIKSNLYYEENNVTDKIENLASVAWIIKGDLIIDPNVSHLVGTFVVLGDGSLCVADSCGQFLSGSDQDAPLQLVVKGLVLAKHFELERRYKASREPSEKFIYDGRVIVNTPPGLENVASGLPSWRDVLAGSNIQ